MQSVPHHLLKIADSRAAFAIMRSGEESDSLLRLPGASDGFAHRRWHATLDGDLIQLGSPNFVQRGRGGIGGEPCVPIQNHFYRGVSTGLRRSYLKQALLPGARHQRGHIGLQGGDVIHGQLVGGIAGLRDEFADALVPVGGVPVIADGMAFIVGNHLMVGSGHEAGRRIEGVWQLIERAPSLPVVAAAAGYGQQAGPWRLAARRPTGGLLADIALHIAINKIF